MPVRKTACAVALSLCFACSPLKRFAYEGFDRDSWQQPDRVVEELGIAAGNRIADLGAGGGYFTFRLADAVEPGGSVYAVDVDDDMISYLENRVATEAIGNVTVVRGRYEDPMLPDGEIDLLFTSNTYHHIQDRVDYFRNLLADLTAEGRVAILELNGATWFPRTFGHYTEPEVIIEEMEAAGYRLERQLDFIDRQSFLIFRRR